MTDVKRLLKGADLPWAAGGNGEHSRAIYAPTDGVNLATTWWDGNPHPTAELILYAVNHLPDYEAAVDALERLSEVAMTEEEDWSPRTQDEWVAALNDAGTILRRLRGEAVAA